MRWISQRQKCIVMYTTVQVRSEFGKFAYTAICMRTLWSDNTCVFTLFHSIKNANTQLIWSSATLRLLDNWICNSNTDIKKKCLLSMKDHVKKKNKDWLTWSPTSDTGFVNSCFCEIAPKSFFMYNGLVQRRHHYHLVNKKYVLLLVT